MSTHRIEYVTNEQTKIRHKTQLSLAWADRTVSPVSESQRPTSGGGKKTLPRVTTVPYTLWWRCYIERYNQCYDMIR